MRPFDFQRTQLTRGKISFGQLAFTWQQRTAAHSPHIGVGVTGKVLIDQIGRWLDVIIQKQDDLSSRMANAVISGAGEAGKIRAMELERSRKLRKAALGRQIVASCLINDNQLRVCPPLYQRDDVTQRVAENLLAVEGADDYG